MGTASLFGEEQGVCLAKGKGGHRVDVLRVCRVVFVFVHPPLAKALVVTAVGTCGDGALFGHQGIGEMPRLGGDVAPKGFHAGRLATGIAAQIDDDGTIQVFGALEPFGQTPVKATPRSVGERRDFHSSRTRPVGLDPPGMSRVQEPLVFSCVTTVVFGGQPSAVGERPIHDRSSG